MSEPQLLSEILPQVMKNIERRCKQNQQNNARKTASHHDRVFAAVDDFHKGRKRTPKEKQAVYQGGKNKQFNLWG
ncbi:MAG: hypothetical protein ACYS1A_18480 [Planctomycetota bacterium]